MAKSTVYHVVKRFKKLGTAEDCLRSGRPHTFLSKTVIKALRGSIRSSLKRSARMTKDINVNVTSM